MPAYWGRYNKLEQLSQIYVKRPRVAHYHDHFKLAKWKRLIFILSSYYKSGLLILLQIGPSFLQIRADLLQIRAGITIGHRT